MNDDQFDGLKQFIEGTVNQSEARLRADLASKKDLLRVERNLNGLHREMQDGFSGVADAIETINERIDKLEHVA